MDHKSARILTKSVPGEKTFPVGRRASAPIPCLARPFQLHRANRLRAAAAQLAVLVGAPGVKDLADISPHSGKFEPSDTRRISRLSWNCCVPCISLTHPRSEFSRFLWDGLRALCQGLRILDPAGLKLQVHCFLASPAAHPPTRPAPTPGWQVSIARHYGRVIRSTCCLRDALHMLNPRLVQETRPRNPHAQF